MGQSGDWSVTGLIAQVVSEVTQWMGHWVGHFVVRPVDWSVDRSGFSASGSVGQSLANQWIRQLVGRRVSGSISQWIRHLEGQWLGCPISCLVSKWSIVWSVDLSVINPDSWWIRQSVGQSLVGQSVDGLVSYKVGQSISLVMVGQSVDWSSFLQ